MQACIKWRSTYIAVMKLVVMYTGVCIQDMAAASCLGLLPSIYHLNCAVDTGESSNHATSIHTIQSY